MITVYIESINDSRKEELFFLKEEVLNFRVGDFIYTIKHRKNIRFKIENKFYTYFEDYNPETNEDFCVLDYCSLEVTFID